MAYQSLYRRYRPQRFAEVRGQDHLVRALRNAVVEGRVGHAYLFSGPRGTGKTSTARILAKVLNCEHVVDGEPCGVCESCLAIEHGTSFDVIELDAASNNGVDAIRDLINRAALGSPGRTKVYILDEVHMLTAGASNALLKTLEEPPDHVVFVLATTDPQKVLPTIRSRTQHFEVHLLPGADLVALVDDVAADAGLDVSAEARDYVLRVGAGSARDTLSALDQVVAAGGIPHDASALDELVEALCERDTGRALIAVEDAINSGRGPRNLGENLIARLRDVFLAAMKVDLDRLPDGDRARVAEQAQRLGAGGATRALEVLGDAFVSIADAPDPRIPLEVALVRLTHPEAEHSLEAIVERLERLERGLGPIGSPPPAPPHTATHPHVDAALADEHDGSGPAPGAAAPPSPAPAEAAPAAPVAPAAPAGEPGGRPADAARQQLAAIRGSRGGPAPARPAVAAPGPAAPAPPTEGGTGVPPRRTPAGSGGARPVPRNPAPVAPPAAPSADERDPAPPSAARPTEADPPVPAPAASGPVAAAGGPAADLPSRDELTLAWGDKVLGGLSQRARSRLSPGRFAEVRDRAAYFALPNPHYVARAEDVRPEAEAALGDHFGRPVPIRIIIDEGAEPPRRRGEPPPPTDADVYEDPDDVDLSLLVDADTGATSSLERIAQVFPGVEVIEGE